MTDQPRPTDAMLLLIQRVSESQIEQGRSQVKQTEDQHAIRLALATLATKLEPLTSMAGELAKISLESHRHNDRLDSHQMHINAMRKDVDDLCSASDKRSGWEVFGGKLLYLSAGAAAAGVVGIVTIIAKMGGA